MKRHLTTILYNVAEESDKNLLESFKCMIQIFKSETSVFTKVPESVYVDMNVFDAVERKAGNITGLMKDQVTNNGKDRANDIKYFEQKGVLLFDAMHASAFGHMSYIYRAKGMRLYLFEDESIGMLSLYSMIDHHGFSYVLEDGFGIDTVESLTITEIEMYLGMFDDLEFKDFSLVSSSLRLLYMLTHIQQDYDRAYYLEYLLYPPDVDVLSSFSKSMRKMIWDIALSESFENSYGEEIQIKLINELSHLEIPPSPNQLTNFYKRHISSKKGVSDLAELAKYFYPNNKQESTISNLQEQEIINRIKADYRPLIITEGKTDWKHLKKALAFFKEKGEFLEIEVSFLEFEDEIDLGDSHLHSLLRSMAKLPNPKKTIGVFDCDEANGRQYAKKEINDLENNIYAFSIPIPLHRKGHSGISIELLYKDSDITRSDNNSRRLCLSSEFNDKGRLIKDKNISVENVDRIRKHLDAETNKIIDLGVTDGEKNIALPKNEFAVNILNSIKPFENIDFEGFREVFERLRLILSL